MGIPAHCEILVFLMEYRLNVVENPSQVSRGQNQVATFYGKGRRTIMSQPRVEGEPRARVSQLRAELAQVTDACRVAHRDGRTEQISGLLRKKSALTRQLFEAQSVLLLLYRAQLERPGHGEGST